MTTTVAPRNMGIVWQPLTPKTIDEQVLEYKAAQAANITGLVYWHVLEQRVVVVTLTGEWEWIYMQAAQHTVNVAQWDKVHIYVRGTERGWLSGQC